MSVKDLRVFIQKQLHEKRFLQDSDEMLASLENLESMEKETGKRIAAAQNEFEPLQKQLDVLTGKIDEAKAHAFKIMSDAGDEAKKIIAGAQETAAKEKAASEAQVTKSEEILKQNAAMISQHKSEISSLKVQISDHQSSLIQAKKAREDFLSNLAKA